MMPFELAFLVLVAAGASNLESRSPEGLRRDLIGIDRENAFEREPDRQCRVRGGSSRVDRAQQYAEQQGNQSESHPGMPSQFNPCAGDTHSSPFSSMTIAACRRMRPILQWSGRATAPP